MGYQPEECTDVYGFAASLFFALTGTLPQDALKRLHRFAPVDPYFTCAQYSAACDYGVGERSAGDAG